jgi:MoxR-like ATPase
LISFFSQNNLVAYNNYRVLVFEQKPKYLLLDELDKLSRRDQAFLLNLMETGIVSETECNKARKIELRVSVFATSNNVEKIIPLKTLHCKTTRLYI